MKGRPQAGLGSRWELSLPGAAPPLTRLPPPAFSLSIVSVLMEKSFRCRLLEWKNHLDVLTLIPCGLLCRSLPGKFVCTDVQARALQHSLAPQCYVPRRVISHYADSRDIACLWWGVWPLCKMRGQRRKKKSSQATLEGFLVDGAAVWLV